MFQRIPISAGVLVLIAASASCGGPSAPLSPSSSVSAIAPASAAPSPGFSRPLTGLTGTLVGAGDIGVCGSRGTEGTARLLDRIPGTVFTAGDNAYMAGRMEDFRNCFEPTWGRHRARTRAVPGNHEYETGGAGYFQYFGAGAGPAGLGYYSFAEGPWRVITLNSEVPSGAGSAQMQWLRAELSDNPTAWTAPIFRIPDRPHAIEKGAGLLFRVPSAEKGARPLFHLALHRGRRGLPQNQPRRRDAVGREHPHTHSLGRRIVIDDMVRVEPVDLIIDASLRLL